MPNITSNPQEIKNALMSTAVKMIDPDRHSPYDKNIQGKGRIDVVQIGRFAGRFAVAKQLGFHQSQPFDGRWLRTDDLSIVLVDRDVVVD